MSSRFTIIDFSSAFLRSKGFEDFHKIFDDFRVFFALSSRDPGHLESFRFESGIFQKFFDKGDSSSGVIVALDIMAVPGMAA